MRERSFEFKDLIEVLKNEHKEFDKHLKRINEAFAKGDSKKAGKILLEIDRLFRQHKIDEESRVLKMIIDVQGREQSREEINIFIKQHQDIIGKIEELAGMTANLSVNDRLSRKADLDKLLRQHRETAEKTIFPKALQSFENKEQQAHAT